MSSTKNIVMKDMLRCIFHIVKYSTEVDRSSDDWAARQVVGLILMMNLLVDGGHVFTRRHCEKYLLFRYSPEDLDDALAFLEQVNVIDWDAGDEADGGERTFVIAMDSEFLLN